MTLSICGTCRHCYPFGERGSPDLRRGECRRYPPIHRPYDPEGLARFPVIVRMSHHWCGEWTPLPPREPKHLTDRRVGVVPSEPGVSP